MIDEKFELLLTDYFNGNLSRADEQELEKWMETSDENTATARQVCYVSQLASRIAGSKNIDVEAALAKTHRRIRKQRRNTIGKYAQRVAACLFAPLLIYTIFITGRNAGQEDISLIEVKSVAGMISHVTLPDGSKVWLNSNSTLTYPSSFGKGERAVTLDGEGYFDVMMQDGKKFSVSARTVTVEVSGTEFNVEAYSDKGGSVTTTLVSGTVDMGYVDITGQKHVVTMKPGETYSYDEKKDVLQKEEKDIVVETSWKDGRIVLNNTSLSDALKMVENRYNVMFLIKNERLLENRYTGTFTDQRLDVILEFFKRTTNMSFDYSLKGMDTDNVSGRQVIIVY